MSQKKRAKNKIAAASEKVQERVRKASLELADLTEALEAAGIIPIPMKEDVAPEFPDLRRAVNVLTSTIENFLVACVEKEADPWPEEENDDDLHPGEEWNEAIAVMQQLELKRCGFSSSLMSFMPTAVERVGYILEKLRKATHEEAKNFKEHQYPPEILSNLPWELPKSITSKKDEFVYKHVSRFHHEIESCGLLVVLAWLNRDAKFFTELAKKVIIAFGGRRKGVAEKRKVKDTTQHERLIDVAHWLWYEEKRNPSRESVFENLAAEGIQIRAKDQSTMLKICKLDFLKSIRGRGRPRKTNASLKPTINESGNDGRHELKSPHIGDLASQFGQRFGDEDRPF